MNTTKALSLALFTLLDIDVRTESEVLRAVNYRLTDSDRQRVLKMAYLYTLEYRPQLIMQAN